MFWSQTKIRVKYTNYVKLDKTIWFNIERRVSIFGVLYGNKFNCKLPLVRTCNGYIYMLIFVICLLTFATLQQD